MAETLEADRQRTQKTTVPVHSRPKKESIRSITNYTSGLRIIDLEDIHSPHEVAYYDTYPASDGPGFRGVWSV